MMSEMSRLVPDIHAAILAERLVNPQLPQGLARRRNRRRSWSQSPLVILAMDHPARRVTAAGGQPWAMADRPELLGRILEVLAQPGVDGLLATPDIMEEVLILNHLVVQRGGQDCLDDKLLIGSMNRGGLAATAFEWNDTMTGYTAPALADMHLDGGKMLLRLNPEVTESGKTLSYCVSALEQLHAHGLPAFLEPLAIPHSTDDLVRLVGVASALGSTSANRWLKLPMTEDFHRVAKATTCPILLLGGNHAGTTDELLAEIRRCLQAGPNVRGIMMGRGVLFPKGGEAPATVGARVAACVHSTVKEEGQRWEKHSSTRLDD